MKTLTLFFVLLISAVFATAQTPFFVNKVTELSNNTSQSKSYFDNEIAKRQRPLNASELAFFRDKLNAQFTAGNVKLLNADKVRAIVLPVLKLYNRENMEIFYYDSPLPSVNLYAESFLIVTKPAADLLKDDLLRAAIAHEMAHEVYSAELFTAQKNKDVSAQESIEKRCDELGAIALRLLNEDPLNITRAVKKIVFAEIVAAKKYNLQINTGTHSTVDDREKSLREFLSKFE